LREPYVYVGETMVACSVDAMIQILFLNGGR